MNSKHGPFKNCRAGMHLLEFNTLTVFFPDHLEPCSYIFKFGLQRIESWTLKKIQQILIGFCPQTEILE